MMDELVGQRKRDDVWGETVLRVARRPAPRQGVATLWLILVLPILIILLFVVAEVANLWMARVELEDALEAAAIAAVQKWGTDNGGDTLAARVKGQTFFASNWIRKHPFTINTNYDNSNPVTNPNQNLVCPGLPGNLIFGSIEEDTPRILRAYEAGGCGGGTVLMDAYGNFTGSIPRNPVQDGTIGIYFKLTQPTLTTLRINTVEIRMPLASNPAQQPVFDPALAPTVVPSFSTPGLNIVSYGFSLGNRQLTLNFPTSSPANPALDFNQGDKLRFYVNTDKLGQGTGEDDGDGFAEATGNNGLPVEVRITFQLGGQTVTSNWTPFQASCCYDDPPTPVPELPILNDACLSKNPPCNNNGTDKGTGDEQSIARINGSGSQKFAVHAQQRITVPSICGNLFGFLDANYFTVQANTTAIYDCVDRCPRLVRINEILCSPPP